MYVNNTTYMYHSVNTALRVGLNNRRISCTWYDDVQWKGCRRHRCYQQRNTVTRQHCRACGKAYCRT